MFGLQLFCTHRHFHKFEKSVYHSLLVSDNTIKPLTKQKMIIWSELKCVWIPTLKVLLVFVPMDLS